MRIALHSVIRAGEVNNYRAGHASIPEELLEAFTRVGITNWTIWRSGTRLFHVVECGDWEQAVFALRDEPANRAWQAYIGPLVEYFRDADGYEGARPLDEVWDLAKQTRGIDEGLLHE